MLRNKEIYKVSLDRREPEKTFYPQIVSFVIWGKEGRKSINKTLLVQGLQNIQADLMHFNLDGSVEVHVLEKEDLIFEFSDHDKLNGWVTAKVVPGVRA